MSDDSVFSVQSQTEEDVPLEVADFPWTLPAFNFVETLSAIGCLSSGGLLGVSPSISPA